MVKYNKPYRQPQQLSDQVDITENFDLQNCSEEDVLSLRNRLIKAREFRETIKSICFELNQVPTVIYNALKQKYGIEILLSIWFNKGIECEILRIGAKGWQKGKLKIKLTLEFCPDEPEIEEIAANNQTETQQSESPLDDIRRMINQNS